MNLKKKHYSAVKIKTSAPASSCFQWAFAWLDGKAYQDLHGWTWHLNRRQLRGLFGSWQSHTASAKRGYVLVAYHGMCLMLRTTSYKWRTKLRFRWNEENFDVLKYFGNTTSENFATFVILNPLPDAAQWTQHVDSDCPSLSISSMSYSFRGNCCGTPRFPVRGYWNSPRTEVSSLEILICVLCCFCDLSRVAVLQMQMVSNLCWPNVGASVGRPSGDWPSHQPPNAFCQQTNASIRT